MQLVMFLAGVFSLALGIVHFFMPVLLDFRGAIPLVGPSLKPFKLLIYSYPTQRSDVHGIAWLMNHCVSLVIVSIGVIDLLAERWLETEARVPVAVWIAAWRFLRAGCQLYLGRRRGDWMVMAFVSALGVLHLALVAIRL